MFCVMEGPVYLLRLKAAPSLVAPDLLFALVRKSVTGMDFSRFKQICQGFNSRFLFTRKFDVLTLPECEEELLNISVLGDPLQLRERLYTFNDVLHLAQQNGIIESM